MKHFLKKFLSNLAITYLTIAVITPHLGLCIQEHMVPTKKDTPILISFQLLDFNSQKLNEELKNNSKESFFSNISCFSLFKMSTPLKFISTLIRKKSNSFVKELKIYNFTDTSPPSI